jgi:hypothetical protein
MEPAYDVNNPDKKNAWKMIQGMLTRGQHNDAFAIALNVFEEDELPLIKILSKLKCKFPFNINPFYSLRIREALRVAALGFGKTRPSNDGRRRVPRPFDPLLWRSD